MPVKDVTKKTSSWEQFYQMVHVQFPHSEMLDIEIREGEINLPEFVDYTVLTSREAALEGRSAPEAWDPRWLRFLKFCRTLENVDLRVIEFRDGIPQFFRVRKYLKRRTGRALDLSGAQPEFRRMATVA